MYQPMVSGVAAEYTAMPLTSGANKWASRAVIVLQLAAWSAVGVVLLQKGVSSLQKMPDLRNNTQVILRNNLPRRPAEELEDAALAVIPLRDFSAGMDDPIGTRDNPWRHDEPAAIVSRDDDNALERMQADSHLPLEEPSTVQDMKDETKKPSKKKKFERLESDKPSEVLEKVNSRTSSDTDARVESTEIPGRVEEVSLEKSSPDVQNSLEDTSRTVPTTSTKSRESGAWENKRKLRMSQLSGGGAAAAVAMVAVGAVMLVLGPAVIILRALDERRQERRFLKLSGQDDLPPTYEQATLMDEAPRYSTLSLNTILGPPPSPSASTSGAGRVQFV